MTTVRGWLKKQGFRQREDIFSKNNRERFVIMVATILWKKIYQTCAGLQTSRKKINSDFLFVFFESLDLYSVFSFFRFSPKKKHFLQGTGHQHCCFRSWRSFGHLIRVDFRGTTKGSRSVGVPTHRCIITTKEYRCHWCHWSKGWQTCCWSWHRRLGSYGILNCEPRKKPRNSGVNLEGKGCLLSVDSYRYPISWCRKKHQWYLQNSWNSSQISSNWSSLEVEFVLLHLKKPNQGNSSSQNIHVDERWTLVRHNFFPKNLNCKCRFEARLSTVKWFFRDSYLDWKYILWLWSSITLKSSRVSTNPNHNGLSPRTAA